MNNFNGLYERAKNETKKKIVEDIHRYVEGFEHIPSYEQYMRERGSMIIHIWQNTWVNLASSQTSVQERKEYLTEKGFNVEDVTRKQLNLLFKHEIRDYHPFDVVKWLESEFADQFDKWEKVYEEARNAFIKREQRRMKIEERQKVTELIESEVRKLLTDYYIKLYVHVRKDIGQIIIEDVDRSGFIPDQDFTTVEAFIDTMLEQSYTPYWKRKRGNLADLDEKYQMLISDYLFDIGPKWLMKHIDSSTVDSYNRLTGNELNEDKLKTFAMEALYTLSFDFFEDLKSEYIDDLQAIIKVPFDYDLHIRLYEQDMKNIEKRLAEEEAILKKRKEEHARMMEDVFGREYRPSASRNMKFVLHIGETNTGKTYQAIQRMKEAKSGLYLAPLRLLALEVYDKLNGEGVPCSLKTGEEEKNSAGASHLSCTVEMFYEKDFYEVVVIDEAQMIADKDRGYSWYKAITKANAEEVHIIGSSNSKTMLMELLNDSMVEVREYVREIPLEVESREFTINQTKKGDALVCFSRNRVLETASILKERGHKASMIYGSMPPETRKKQMRMFIEGDTNVIVATDAIGMGLNLPIRRIVFLENEKFDGTRRRTLTSQEVKQIAGRAGRKGLYEVGKVAFTKDISHMSKLLHKQDEILHTFAIAPTSNVLERFEKYSRHLGEFFELWKEYDNPPGTRKAPLVEARELYDFIKDSEIEERLSLKELYSFINMPFSSFEPALAAQWKQKMFAIIEKADLPEPILKNDTLEELELSYKSIGLHLLFLYRLDKRTETVYWERLREEVSNKIHDLLKAGVKIPDRTCKTCGTLLPRNFRFMHCDDCFLKRQTKNMSYFHR